MNNKDNINIDDIAVTAGVSTATVSRYFNKPGIVAEKSSNRIQKAIEDLGYIENKAARSLATGKTEFVCIIIQQLELSYYSEFLNKVIEYANLFNLKCIVYISRTTKEDEMKYINEMIAHNVRGIITLSHLLSKEEYDKFNTNFVTIEREITKHNSIVSNNYLGAKIATEKLITDNCEVIIHINDAFDEKIPGYNRLYGVRDSAKNKIYIELNDQRMTDREIRKELLNRRLKEIIEEYGDKKIGIFCANDNFARRTINTLLLQNINIPEQVEVIGYDNSPIAKQCIIPITTIDQNLDMIARTSIKMINEDIRGEKVVIEPQLVLRLSTK